MSAVLTPIKNQDYEIADLSLAPWGRKELTIAETEMPGLMAIRQEFAKRFGILDKRRLHRLEPVELEGCADLLQPAAHGGEFGRPPIPKATRQPRVHLAGGSVLGSIDRRRHRAGLILVKLTQCVLTHSDASGKGA